MWYVLDWLSLVKARLIIRKFISTRYAVISTAIFFVIDISASYMITGVFSTVIDFVTDEILYQRTYHFTRTAQWFLQLDPLYKNFLNSPGHKMRMATVVIPSTLLTSVWTFLVFISSVIAQLLVPIDYVRRFAAWWFRDVDKHPLTVIAKVAATLIIVAAGAIKVVRWI